MLLFNFHSASGWGKTALDTVHIHAEASGLHAITMILHIYIESFTSTAQMNSWWQCHDPQFAEQRVLYNCLGE